MDYSSKSVAVVDNGQFPELAITLASSFGKVFYAPAWLSDLPSSYRIEIGEGFREFERVDDIWGILDDVDLFVFPDLYQGPLQEYLAETRYPSTDKLGEHLEKKGKRVWGARNGDELETYRVEAKQHFKELGIPQAPYEVVKGMSRLRTYLESRDGEKVWVKISFTRRDTETFPVVDYRLVKNMLDTMESELGPAAEHMEFIVEDDLPDSIDVAIDTYSIDGKFPSLAAIGTERKDEGYICAVKKWSEMPEKIVDIYDRLSPTLERYQYRSMLSLESRVTDGAVYLGDPCCRSGSPPFELQLNMLENLPDILWNGAEGKLIDPQYSAKYGFEILIQSEWANTHPLLVEFPEKHRENIKLRFCSRFGKETWFMPQNSGIGTAVIGAIVTCGDSIEGCFEEAKEIACTIKGHKVEAFTGAITELSNSMQKLKQYGVNL